MDVLKVLKQGLDVLLHDIVVLLVAGLIACALTCVTLGVLAGPSFGALFKMVWLRLKDNREPKIGDVVAFERTGQLILAFLITIVLEALGMMLILPGIYLMAIWLYVIPLIVDRGLGLNEAMRESKAMVEKNGLGPHVALALLIALITVGVTSLTHMLGAVVVVPYSLACTAIAYQIVTRQQASLAAGEPPTNANAS